MISFNLQKPCEIRMSPITFRIKFQLFWLARKVLQVLAPFDLCGPILTPNHLHPPSFSSSQPETLTLLTLPWLLDLTTYYSFCRTRSSSLPQKAGLHQLSEVPNSIISFHISIVTHSTAFFSLVSWILSPTKSSLRPGPYPHSLLNPE